MQREEEKGPEKRKVTSDPGRMKRETRPETRPGQHADMASVDAAERVTRAKHGPPPSDEEKEIIAASPHRHVEMFTTVTVADVEHGDRDTYRIVPEGEGDPVQGKISISSPLGRAMAMEYPGAVVEMKAPRGSVWFRILRVE